MCYYALGNSEKMKKGFESLLFTSNTMSNHKIKSDGDHDDDDLEPNDELAFYMRSK